MTNFFICKKNQTQTRLPKYNIKKNKESDVLTYHSNVHFHKDNRHCRVGVFSIAGDVIDD